MDARDKEQTEQAEQTADELWNEIAVDDETGNLVEAPADTDKPKAGDQGDDKGLSADEPDPQGFSGDVDPNAKPEKPATTEQTVVIEEEISVLRKRLSDTQAWGQTLANEVSELRRMIASGTATKAELDGQKKVVDEATKNIAPEALDNLYAEMPEAKAVIEPLLATVEKLTGEVEKYRESEQAKAKSAEEEKLKSLVENFERNILPEVRKTHSDYDPMKLGESGYFEWAEKQRPALRFAALQSDDPADITWAYGEFKKHQATPEAQNLKKQQESQKQERMQAAMSLRGGGGSGISGGGKSDPDDKEAAWNDPEFDKKLKADGLL